MLPGIIAQEFPVPSMADKLKNKNQLDGYSYKIFKGEADDLAAMSDLELILTRGIAGDDIVILEKDKFTFMDRYFLIVHYLQKNPE